MKPYGMTALFQIVRPTSAENRIWEAVEEAIAEGMTPTQFRREAAAAWEHSLHEAAKSAVRDLSQGGNDGR